MQQTTLTYIATATLILVVLLIGGVITGMALSERGDTTDDEGVTSFEECVAAGNPVMESFPEQCRTEDGRTFTRDIGNILEKTDMIQVSSPRPGDEVEQSFTAEGQARGPWFFEASFPVFVENDEGERIGSGIAQAQDEWTTEEFVPFVAEVSLDTAYEGDATLIFEKQNASGLPENADSVHFPVTITSEGASDGVSDDPIVRDGCYIGGCSSQVCSEDPDVVTTCEWRSEYACYEQATCERQDNGECGWTQTEELHSCLQSS